MKRDALHSNLMRTIAHLACLLGMLRTAGAGAERRALGSAETEKDHRLRGGGWKDGQVQEPCILVNPKDAGKLIMFYAGMTPGGGMDALARRGPMSPTPSLGMKTRTTRC